MKKATDRDRGAADQTGVHPMADLDWLKIVSGVIKRTILILVTPSKQQ